jgi:rubrerythrin
MDLKNYGLEDLLLTALKGEVDSFNAYKKVAERVKNFFLREKLNFLAGEELKHREFLETLYRRQFPDKKLVLPPKVVIPLPELNVAEGIPISQVFEQAMSAEKFTEDFYLSLAEKFSDDQRVKQMLLYIANMERGHYYLLEIERENAKIFEVYEEVMPAIHIGP